MNLEQLQLLVKKGESDTLEFKTSTRELRGVFETVCAFLNNQGGIILIGVGDNGKITGQQISDQTKKDVAVEIVKIEPSAQAQINIEYVSVGCDKQVIVLEIGRGNHAPYTYDGRSFMRAQSTTNRMTQHRYEQLIVERGQLNHSWEDQPAVGYSIKDLDEDLILRVVRLAVQGRRLSENALRDTPTEILKKFNLLQNDQLTSAAIVLFCKDEAKQFIQSQLRLARFKGLNKNEFIDNKMFTGNAFYLYDQAMLFLNNHLPIAGKISDKSPVRVDTPAIPYKVLREAIINAIVHRDYTIRGGAISLAVYDDRVEVSSAGILPAGISIEDLRTQHRSVLRNPLIAKVFYACGYIEMWGRGTQTMTELCEEVGNPWPQFIATSGDFTVCLPLKESIVLGAVKLTKSKAHFEQLTFRQQEILKLLSGGKMLTSIEIFKGIAVPPSLRTVKAELSILKKKKIIEGIGKGRSTVWKLK